jgi:hypothetical protein
MLHHSQLFPMMTQNQLQRKSESETDEDEESKREITDLKYLDPTSSHHTTQQSQASERY